MTMKALALIQMARRSEALADYERPQPTMD
jgi:hypothetical protein